MSDTSRQEDHPAKKIPGSKWTQLRARVVKMSITARVLVASSFIAVVGTMLTGVFWYISRPSSPEEQQVFVNLISLILVGFLASVLGTSVPSMLTEQRDNFNRRADARGAYTEAKTAILYLPLRVDLPWKQAVELVSDAHQLLHKAETAPQLLSENLVEWYRGHRRTWISQCYWQLTAVRLVLEAFEDEWDGTDVDDGLILRRNRMLLVESRMQLVLDRMDWLLEPGCDRFEIESDVKCTDRLKAEKELDETLISQFHLDRAATMEKAVQDAEERLKDAFTFNLGSGGGSSPFVDASAKHPSGELDK